MFNLDPIIKREFIWAGPAYRSASCLVERQGAVVKVREGRRWRVYTDQLSQSSALAIIRYTISAISNPFRSIIITLEYMIYSLVKFECDISYHYC